MGAGFADRLDVGEKRGVKDNSKISGLSNGRMESPCSDMGGLLEEGLEWGDNQDPSFRLRNLRCLVNIKEEKLN